jgi:hypothetical protein
MTTLHLRKSIVRSPLRRGFLLIALALILAWFALLPAVRAVSPPPDGGYPNRTTAEGANALLSLTAGTDNTALGFDALSSNTTGGGNTASGAYALLANTTGGFNTASGAAALYSNTTGYYNTACGAAALYRNTTGNLNTACGADALSFNTTGNSNTASGDRALFLNTTGSGNTGSGSTALFSNTTGSNNVADGYTALYSNTTGVNNTATGYHALYSNQTGNSNTAAGVNVLLHNSASSNTAVGLNALLLNTTGANNIALGASAGSTLTTGSNNIEIGNVGVAAEANTIRIGKTGTQQATYIAGISGKAVAGGIGVIVDSNGHLGTVVSSARYKENIEPMDKASEAILALNPVTFRYKPELDPDGIPQFGLVAEDVEKVNPDLVVRDAEGKVFTVRYEAVNAMLLNEFLKEHRKLAQLEATVAQQQTDFEATIAQQEKDFQSKLTEQQNRINVLASGLEKVTAQFALSKAASRTVRNGP